MCKKQAAVFHSSVESEIISLHVGLRMDGLPALQCWDCYLDNPPPGTTLSINGMRRAEPSMFIFVPANIRDISHLIKLINFEDNAAVIQMINKGRSPNLRHVTRTHMVNFDLLLERIRF